MCQRMAIVSVGNQPGTAPYGDMERHSPPCIPGSPRISLCTLLNNKCKSLARCLTHCSYCRRASSLPSPLLPGMFIYFLLEDGDDRGKIGKRRGMNKVRRLEEEGDSSVSPLITFPWQRASCESASVILIKASEDL